MAILEELEMFPQIRDVVQQNPNILQLMSQNQDFLKMIKDVDPSKERNNVQDSNNTFSEE